MIPAAAARSVIIIIVRARILLKGSWPAPVSLVVPSRPARRGALVFALEPVLDSAQTYGQFGRDDHGRREALVVGAPRVPSDPAGRGGGLSAGSTNSSAGDRSFAGPGHLL